MEDILRKLYFGKINPCGQLDIQAESFKQAGKACDEATQSFKRSLSASQQQEFERLEDIKHNYDREYDALNFRSGFQLGMQLAVAGLDKDRLDELLKD